MFLNEKIFIKKNTSVCVIKKNASDAQILKNMRCALSAQSDRDLIWNRRSVLIGTRGTLCYSGGESPSLICMSVCLFQLKQNRSRASSKRASLPLRRQQRKKSELGEAGDSRQWSCHRVEMPEPLPVPHFADPITHAHTHAHISSWILLCLVSAWDVFIPALAKQNAPRSGTLSTLTKPCWTARVRVCH